MDEKLGRYIREHTQPDILDIEIAKQIILEHLSIVQANFEPIGSSQLVSMVSMEKQAFDKPIFVEIKYAPQLKDQLIKLSAELAAREALHSLHANGILIAYGPLTVASVPGGHFPEQTSITLPDAYRDNQIVSITLPCIHVSYGLAAPFRGNQAFRLASGDIYLSSLNQVQLPSRAKRCLRECIDAFRYGLYLSATMSVGAASESLWMKLGSLVCIKNPVVTTKLGEQLKRLSPSVKDVIERTWQVLPTNFGNELDQVFLNTSEKNAFKDHANRLCDRRNYAMHNEDADEDEPYFTHNETGMLLQGSISYFKQLTKLVTTIEALP